MTKKSINILIFTVSILLVFLYFMFYRISKLQIKSMEVDSEITVLENMHYGIDTNEVKDNKYVIISGWVLQLNVDISSFDTYVLLKDESTGDFYKIPTVMQIRDDLNTIFQDGKDYMNSGFYAKGNIDALRESTYKIYLLYMNNDKKTIINCEKSIKIGR